MPRLQADDDGKEEGSQSSRFWEEQSWTKQRREEDQGREEGDRSLDHIHDDHDDHDVICGKGEGGG